MWATVRHLCCYHYHRAAGYADDVSPLAAPSTNCPEKTSQLVSYGVTINDVYYSEGLDVKS